MKKAIYSAVIHKGGEWYVAQCPEVGTASQGRTQDVALANLKEATELYLEEFGEVAALDQAGISFRQVNDQDEELYTPAEVFGPPDPGRILRGARAREGLTQRELAERIGARQHHISEMENGRRSITPDMARKLAQALDAADYRVFL